MAYLVNDNNIANTHDISKQKTPKKVKTAKKFDITLKNPCKMAMGVIECISKNSHPNLLQAFVFPKIHFF